LQRHQVVAIVPPPSLSTEPADEILEVVPVLSVWVRGTLLGVVLGLVVVFTIAWRLDPYVRPAPEDRAPFVGTLAAAPEAGFPANLPWAALVLSQETDVSTSPRRMETHRQLGLPPCTFYLMTDLPCPSCGMTTSFSLLAHGDVGNSLRANFVGTLLALFGLVVIPWGLACAVTGRTYFIVSIERGLIAVIVTFLTLLIFRWALVLGVIWYGKLSG
jgi:hypothetical protein